MNKNKCRGELCIRPTSVNASSQGEPRFAPTMIIILNYEERYRSQR